MKSTKLPGKWLMVWVALAGLPGCATSELSGGANRPVVAAAPAVGLTLAEAIDMSGTERIQFQSAMSLALQRPHVEHEIVALELGIRSADEPNEKRSLMEFSTLPTGLNYYVQRQAGFNEAAIDLFGTVAVAYSNSRVPAAAGEDRAVPDQIHLVSGRLFAGDASFTLSVSDADGEIVRMQCTPIGRVAASTIHRTLTGKAAILHCTLSSGAESNTWYLEDYARYLNFEVQEDGIVQARVTVKDVTVRS